MDALLSDRVGELFGGLPERVTFWSGAGISKDAPTQAPLGIALTERALEQAFERDTLLRELRAAYRALELDRALPRLETVLDVAADEHGTDILKGATR